MANESMSRIIDFASARGLNDDDLNTLIQMLNQFTANNGTGDEEGPDNPDKLQSAYYS